MLTDVFFRLYNWIMGSWKLITNCWLWYVSSTYLLTIIVSSYDVLDLYRWKKLHQLFMGNCLWCSPLYNVKNINWKYHLPPNSCGLMTRISSSLITLRNGSHCVVYLSKKGDLSIMTNYRGITQMSFVANVIKQDSYFKVEISSRN